MTRWIERALIVLVSLAVAVGVIALLSGGLTGGRDDPGIAIHTTDVPGRTYPDLGDRHLKPGAPRPRYNSDPPTSGAHVPVAVTRNGARLSDDQLLQALAAGDVVFLYSTPTPPRGLQAIADRVAPRFTAALAAHGQTVILARRQGLSSITALAWRHLLRSNETAALLDFGQYWLGKGAGPQVTQIVGNS